MADLLSHLYPDTLVSIVDNHKCSKQCPMCASLLVQYVTMASYPNILNIITNLIERQPSVLDHPLALETACKNSTSTSSIEIARYLIERSILPDNILNLTLQYICKGTASEEIAVLLIKTGAKISIHDNHNYTPLLYAVSLDSETLVTLLLDKGADINEYQNIDRWTSGYTPLLCAVRLSRENLVRILLERGANPNLSHVEAQGSADSFYYTSPLKYASDGNDVTIMKLLTDHGAINR